MKTLILSLSLMLIAFTVKAQYATPLIDSVAIDISVGTSDTIITYFPIEQLGGAYSISIDASDLSADFSWGIIVSGIRGIWGFLPNTVAFPITVTNSSHLVGGLGDNLMFPFVGIWIDRKTNSSGVIIAKRIMVWEIKSYIPF